MAYNQGGYGQQGQQGQQGYGQYNPYGQSANPYSGQQSNQYAQQEQPYGHSGNYSERPDLHQQSSSRYDEESAQGGSYEMSNMNGRDPNRILNEVRNLDAAVDAIEAQIPELRRLHKAHLDSTNTSRNNEAYNRYKALENDIMDRYRGLLKRATGLKSDPESQNPRNKAQVGKIERRIKAAMNQQQQVNRQLCKDSEEQMARDYRIVRPDASDAEVQEAIQDSNGQIFSQSLLASDRRGQVQSAAKQVQNRHAEIQNMEKNMAELAQLFMDFEAMVVQQEPAVTQIEEKGMEASGHVAQANTELDGAVKKARSARKKKWICLGIAILIVLIIAAVIAIAVTLTRGKTSS